MPYEVTAAEGAPTERLVVSVGGKTVVFGEATDADREAAEAGELSIASGDPVIADTDQASDLALLAERVPEVAAAVTVTHIPDEEPVDVEPEEVVIVHPADPADSVVPAGETTPELERVTIEDAVEDVERYENEGGK